MKMSISKQYDYLLNSGDQLIILYDKHYKITDRSGNEFYYFIDHLGDGKDFGQFHNPNGAGIIWKSGEKEYYWMGNQIECKSDEEWKTLVALKEFW